jgi:hypothetical protein
MELVGILDIVGSPTGVSYPGTKGRAFFNEQADLVCYDDPSAYVISKNIHRRHLTKEQQAEFIVKVRMAAWSKDDLAKTARSFSQSGKRGGSTKDALKEKVVEDAKNSGIGKRTAEKAIANVRGPTLPRRESKPPAAMFNATIQKHGISRVVPEPRKYQAQNLVPHEITPAVTIIPEKSSAPVEKPIPRIVPDIEPPAESVEHDAAFKGINSYEIKFTVDGSRLPQVKKRILQLFPNWSDEIEVISLNGKATSRADRLEEAKGIVEELLGEIQSWHEPTREFPSWRKGGPAR